MVLSGTAVLQRFIGKSAVSPRQSPAITGVDVFSVGHVDVARFYRRISKMEEGSPTALKWKDRLHKDRGKLFTFLNHDGVPWNNNNAEHAIKAFARLRRAIEGLSTPKGIEEYLVLLGVCQTCKYFGLDFLGFLRSGERDVRGFGEPTKTEPALLNADRTRHADFDLVRGV